MLIVPEWSSLGLFVIAALVLLLTPGPALDPALSLLGGPW